MIPGFSATLLTLQETPPPAGGGGGGGSFAPLLFQFAVIFLIFYFLIIRPQQRQRKRHDEALRNLRRGDHVVTSGGIVADVIHIKERVNEGAPQPAMDDEITIKSGETRLIVERGRIAKIKTDSGVVTAPKEKPYRSTDAT